jgi:ABC-2 type transport system ATP-binding protein
MSDLVVDVRGVSRRFGNTLALNNLDFQIRPGLVYGLVGANGAGKTTLIKHLLGLLRAEQGEVRMFGMDPVVSPVEVLQRIGYLSESRDLPEWTRIDELFRYTAAFHPQWDESYAEELRTTFGLDVSKKVKALSKGMRAQAGLICAAAHRPSLLLLDEPSTGLDAIVRRDILNAIIRAVADDGRTALFSSHLLDEVEQMSDYVFMIDAGKLVLEGDLDDVKSQHHFMSIQLPQSAEQFPETPSVLSAERRGNSWVVTCQGEADEVHHSLKGVGAEIVNSRHASLQEIFVARVGRDRMLETQESS